MLEEEGAEAVAATEENLKVSVYEIERIPFSSAMRGVEAAELCNHLNFAVYDMAGTRLKQINQIEGDEDFGVAGFKLTEGTYQLVVVGHSSEGNPTMTNPEKIQFTPSKKYTDTFLYYTTFSVADKRQDMNVSLHRIVSLCRLMVTDAIPEGVAKMTFRYKGGSGHFNGLTGYGVPMTKGQESTFEVEPGQTNVSFDLYTFLPADEGEIHVTVVGYDSDENVQLEQEYDFPMKTNYITKWTGELFNGFTPSSSQSMTSSVTIDGEWAGEIEIP
jgi:hypothetical protein